MFIVESLQRGHIVSVSIQAHKEMYSEFPYFDDVTARGALGFMADADVFAEVLQSALPDYPRRVRLRAVRHVREFLPTKTFTLRVLGLKDPPCMCSCGSDRP